MTFVSRQEIDRVLWAATLICAVICSIASLTQNVACQGEDDPSDEAISLFNKGQDSHEKGDLTGAIENYDKALKLVPDFPEAQLQRAYAYQSLGKLDDAEAAFRRAVDLREDWSLGLAGLGAVLVRKNNFVDAERFLSRAIELDELNFPAYAAMTELRLKTKAPPDTINSLLSRLRALTSKANPTASIWASRAAIESAVGDRKNAKASAARALELEPKNVFALSTAADISLLDHDSASAEILVKRLESLAPQSQSAKGLRARLLIEKGKTEEAITLLNSVEKPGQEILDLKKQIAAGSTSDIAELEKQLVSDANNSVILAKLCIGFRTVDPAKAIEYCRRASQADPQNIQPLIGYGAALVQAKRYDEAVVAFQRLLAIAPANSTARANLATALFQLKRYPEAKTEFRWLTDHQPDQAAAYYFLAIIHDQLTEFVDAAANYQQFLRLADPESSKLEIEKVNLRLPVVQKFIKEGKGKRRG